jgi:hypothetical protein
MALSELIEAYLAAAQQLRKAVAGMTADQAAHPITGKWSTLEVACHLADIDALDVDRMKRIIAEERPTLMDCNQNLYAASLAYQQRDLNEEVTLIELGRAQMARETRSLEQLLKKGQRHFQHHIPFILEKRRALGLPA